MVVLLIFKNLSKLEELHLRTPTCKKYNYCGPGRKVEKRLNSGDPKYRDAINKLNAICQQHDIAYSKAGNDLAKKHKADDVMVQSIGDIPFSQRPWFPTPVKYTMQAKTLLGLGLTPKKCKKPSSEKNCKKN